MSRLLFPQGLVVLVSRVISTAVVMHHQEQVLTLPRVRHLSRIHGRVIDSSNKFCRLRKQLQIIS